MRPECLDCVRKHLGQAIVLMNEARLGYPDHKWLAVGHMAEAEHEAPLEFALLIREQRLNYMGGGHADLLGIVSLVSATDAGEDLLPDLLGSGATSNQGTDA